jgi:Tfp pilus assembly protein PilF
MNTIKVTIRREVVSLVIVGLICVASSCRSRSSEEAPANPTETAAEYVSQADQLYAQREDLLRLRQAIVLLRQAITIDPGNYDASWRLAKFNYYLATHTDNNDERNKAFRDGIEVGKTAVELQNGKPDGHFWLGANYGAAAQKSTIAGLATVGDIRNEMETVLRLDEGYQDGSAYMVLGLVYLDEPGILGGNPQKAVELMEKGLRFGEGNAFLHLHLAEAYLKVGRTADARRQLNAIISMTPNQNYLPEYKEAVSEARKLLEKTGTAVSASILRSQQRSSQTITICLA